jgi:hypothetical protein
MIVDEDSAAVRSTLTEVLFKNEGLPCARNPTSDQMVEIGN